MTKCYLFETKGAFMNDWILLGSYATIEAAKKASMRKIGKNPRKMLAILSNTTMRATDILYMVSYQKGSLYWKNKEMAKEHTGYVFNGFGNRGQQFIKSD